MNRSTRIFRLCTRFRASNHSWCVLGSFQGKKGFANLVNSTAKSSYLSCCPARLLTTDAPNWTEAITCKEIKKMLSEDNIQLFDVREPHELIQHGRMPKSTNIPCMLHLLHLSIMHLSICNINIPPGTPPPPPL